MCSHPRQQGRGVQSGTLVIAASFQRHGKGSIDRTRKEAEARLRPWISSFFFWPLMYPPKKFRKAHMADTAAAVVELTEGSELCFQDLFEAFAALATHLSRSTQVGARPTGQLAIWSAAPSAIWPRKSRFGCRAHGSIDKLAELHLDAARSAVGCVSCMHVHLRRSNSRLQTSSHRVCSAVTASSQHFRPSLPLAAAVLLG